MNRTERTKIKKKGKRYHIIGYGLAIWGILFLIALFATPLLHVVRNINENGSEFMVLLIVSGIVVLIMVPLLGSLMFVSFGTTQYQKLLEFKWNIKDQRNKFHMKLFWDAIKEKNYDEAKRLYNKDGFISGDERVLCNGILMGLATQVPIDHDWGKKVDERMISYL